MTACLGQPHVYDSDAIIASLKEEVSALLDENTRLSTQVKRLCAAIQPIAELNFESWARRPKETRIIQRPTEEWYELVAAFHAAVPHAVKKILNPTV